MPKSDAKTQKPQPLITVRIEPGNVSRGQLQQWQKLWLRLILEARHEVDNQPKGDAGSSSPSA